MWGNEARACQWNLLLQDPPEVTWADPFTLHVNNITFVGALGHFTGKEIKHRSVYFRLKEFVFRWTRRWSERSDPQRNTAGRRKRHVARLDCSGVFVFVSGHRWDNQLFFCQRRLFEFHSESKLTSEFNRRRLRQNGACEHGGPSVYRCSSWLTSTGFCFTPGHRMLVKVHYNTPKRVSDRV